MKRFCLAFILLLVFFGGLLPVQGQDLESLFRGQVFNKVFENFDFYWITIEEDVQQSDGSREVTVTVSGKFLENTKRMKVLFLLQSDEIIGGQILENDGLPPCGLAPRHHSNT